MSKFSTHEIASELTRIENRDPKALANLKKIFSVQSLRRTICFTGPAGVGKSTLISKLAPLAARKKTLAWLACDPSSPKSGGSLLGDRIRLSGQEISENIFIRSLSTRGAQAFSKSIRDMEVYLESIFDEIWVETAGSGQTQSEVARLSAITVLILQPETGDEIQWMKSGVREWADLFIVHKADLKGADLMAQTLVEQGAKPSEVIQVSSKNNKGFENVLSALQNFQKKMNWNERQKILHLEHARALFFEKAQKKLETEFEKSKAKKVKNPYV
ncbi:MAG: hypothetical protein J0L93_07905 [Deltaproteobacteria bacterium]|nr:hypothetical protein [Deltaproteobacteria bacterium]